MKGPADFPDHAVLAAMHVEAVRARQDCIVTDLQVVESFIRIAHDWSGLGQPARAQRALVAGKRGIANVRRSLSSNNFIEPLFKWRSLLRCEELERRLLESKPK
jgi:hypothetical protein